MSYLPHCLFTRLPHRMIATAIAIVVLSLSSSVSMVQTQSGATTPVQPPLVELFGASGEVLQRYAVTLRQHGLPVDTYPLDAIARWEHRLSGAIPTSPKLAKAAVLQQMARLTPQDIEALKRSAQGLVKARHYGLDRYPALVVNEQAIVYGLPTPIELLTHYRHWQQGRAE